MYTKCIQLYKCILNVYSCLATLNIVSISFYDLPYTIDEIHLAVLLRLS
jgi:hypothetical protein